jgi:hypothetical protein
MPPFKKKLGPQLANHAAAYELKRRKQNLMNERKVHVLERQPYSALDLLCYPAAT